MPSGVILGSADYQRGHWPRGPLQTYKGVAMRDDEEGEWRVVVDLEWPKSKTPGIPYGNMKGRLLACGLMPGHHGNEIEAA